MLRSPTVTVEVCHACRASMACSLEKPAVAAPSAITRRTSLSTPSCLSFSRTDFLGANYMPLGKRVKLCSFCERCSPSMEGDAGQGVGWRRRGGSQGASGRGRGQGPGDGAEKRMCTGAGPGRRWGWEVAGGSGKGEGQGAGDGDGDREGEELDTHFREESCSVVSFIGASMSRTKRTRSSRCCGTVAMPRLSSPYSQRAACEECYPVGNCCLVLPTPKVFYPRPERRCAVLESMAAGYVTA